MLVAQRQIEYTRTLTTLGDRLRALRERFLSRSAELDVEANAAIVTGRINALCRRAARVMVDVDIYTSGDRLPTMAWFDDARPYRSQPRDGRGRFLPKSWLAAAELFLPVDSAFFRSPIGAL